MKNKDVHDHNIVKINFTNFWDNFNIEDNFITDILKTKYQVEISETPDYVFSSMYIPTGAYRLHGVLEPASRKVRTTFTETEPMQI